MEEGPWVAEPPPKEPLFRAPPVLLVLCAVLVAVHAVLWFGPFSGPQVVADCALTGQAMAQRRWTTLITYIFLHAGWAHVLMNTGFALAFGTAPARLFGPSWRGAVVFVAFFLACGVISGLGYAALRPGPGWAVIGASGAVSGLMGATARMLGQGGRLGPPWGAGFASMTISWIVLNVLLGLTGIGAGLAGGALVAWQMHIIGFAVGAALIDLFWGLAGRRDPITQ